MNFPIRPVMDEIDKIAALGFDYLELAMDPPCAHYSVISPMKRQLVRSLEDHGLKLVCHLPSFVYTADLTPGIREASLKEMMASLETASDLGPLKVVLHPSVINGMGGFVRATTDRLAMESLGAIVEKARSLGICLCLENMFPRYGSFWQPLEFKSAFDQYPDLRMTLDVGHAHIGDPTGNRIADFIRVFGDRIGHIHISDNFGKIDDHLPVGKASIDFVRLARNSRAMAYDSTITFEIFSDDPRDLVRSRDRFSAFLKAVPV